MPTCRNTWTSVDIKYFLHALFSSRQYPIKSLWKMNAKMLKENKSKQTFMCIKKNINIKI